MRLPAVSARWWPGCLRGRLTGWNQMWRVKVAAFAELARARVTLVFHRMRVLLFWWLLGLGARPMILLRTGAWVDCSRGFAPDQVRAIYNAETHCVTAVGAEGTLGSRDRWPWLAAAETEGARRDLSDFFGGLRVSQSLGLTSAAILGLFVCQKGWMPRGTLSVTQRDGTVMLVDALTGMPVEAAASAASEGVNYVR
jgi:hypothetical protein